MKQVFLRRIISKKKQNNVWLVRSTRVCKFVNYIVQSFILVSAVAGFISVYSFASLVIILMGILSPEKGINICVHPEENKKTMTNCTAFNSI